MLFTILWWSFLAFIAYLVWYKWAGTTKREIKVSPLTIVFAIILTITVSSFFMVIWEDLGDSARQGKSPYSLAPQQKAAIQFKSILYHTAFVIPVVILALVFYFLLYKRGRKYSAMIAPYLVGSLFIVGRLLFDIGEYIIQEYKQAGIYAILVVLMVVFSVIVFFVQQKWEERKRERQETSLS